MKIVDIELNWYSFAGYNCLRNCSEISACTHFGKLCHVHPVGATHFMLDIALWAVYFAIIALLTTFTETNNPYTIQTRQVIKFESLDE